MAGLVENRKIKAKIEDKVIEIYPCKDGIVNITIPKPSSENFDFGMLNSIPTSISVFTDTPDELFDRTLLVSSVYDQVK